MDMFKKEKIFQKTETRRKKPWFLYIYIYKKE